MKDTATHDASRIYSLSTKWVLSQTNVLDDVLKGDLKMIQGLATRIINREQSFTDDQAIDF